MDRETLQQYGIDDDVMNYLNNGNELQTHNISLSRASRDTVRNNFGNKLLQLCDNNNLHICNGRIDGDVTGALTCIRGSVIDYLICNLEGLLLVRWMTQVKKKSLHPPRYQGCYISSCREFYAEFNAKCCQSGNLCRKFVNMIL